MKKKNQDWRADDKEHWNQNSKQKLILDWADDKEHWNQNSKQKLILDWRKNRRCRRRRHHHHPGRKGNSPSRPTEDTIELGYRSQKKAKRETRFFLGLPNTNLVIENSPASIGLHLDCIWTQFG